MGPSFRKVRHAIFTWGLIRAGIKIQPFHTQRISRQDDVMMHIKRVFFLVINWKNGGKQILKVNRTPQLS